MTSLLIFSPWSFFCLSLLSISFFFIGSAWSDGVASRGSCWLLLSNLTPQVKSEKIEGGTG